MSPCKIIEMPASAIEGGIQFQLKRELVERGANPSGFCYDLSILEYFFHMTIKLRLANESETALKQAHEYSTMISKLIGILMVKFDGTLPFDGVSEARKLMAKFVGLVFFKVHRDCLMKGIGKSGTSSCCRKHQIEGLREGHSIFLNLLEPYKIKIDQSFEDIDDHLKAFLITLHAVFIDLKTQIVVGELSLLAQSGEEHLGHRLETLMETLFGDSLEIPYMKIKLQGRAIQLRAIIDQYDLDQIPAELEAKFSFSLFEDNLRCFLKCLYASYPKCELMEEKVVTVTVVEQRPQEPIRESVQERIHEQPFEDMEPFEPEPIEPKSPVKTATSKNKADVSVPVDKKAKIEHVSVSVDVKKDNEKTTALAPVTISPFSGVVISGRFFRGVLEPNDDRFAAIVEGRDVNVKQYLLERKRKAASLAVRKGSSNAKVSTAAKVSVSAPVRSENAASSASLLERHNSAERVGWETQEPRIEDRRFGDMESIASTSPKPQKSYKPTTTSSRKTQSKPSDPSDERKPVRGRRRFEEEEVKNLIEGMRRFGNDWRRIQNNYKFHDRTNVDLKDKARNLAKMGLI